MPIPESANEIPAARPARPWIKWVRIALGLGLLAFLVARADLSQLGVRLGWSAVPAIALVIAMLGLAQGLSALRWKVLLADVAAPWWYLFRLYLIAAFFSLFLPTAVGGDAVRAAAASRALGRPSEMIGIVLADRALGVVALVVFFVFGAAIAGTMGGIGLDWRPSGTLLLVAAIGIAVAIGAAVAFRRRLAGPLAFVRRVVGSVFAVARDPRRLAAALALGIAVQAVYVAAWIVTARALGLELPAVSFLVTVPIVSLSAMAPITLSGVGVREGAWILLLEPWGVPAADALALSLLYFGCWTVVSGAGGIWLAARGMALDRGNESNPTSPAVQPAPLSGAPAADSAVASARDR